MPKSQQALTKTTLPHAYHHGDLRNALITAGLAVLVEHGAAGLNLREVARRAGVSHAAPYRHFVDKEALVSAIAQDGFEKLAQAINKIDAQSAHSTVQDTLITAGECYVRFALEHPDHFRVMFSGKRSAEEDSSLYQVSKVGFLFLVRTVLKGQTSGVFSPGDPVEIAKSIWVSVHGIALLIIERQLPDFGNTTAQIRKNAALLVRTTLQRIFDGICAR